MKNQIVALVLPLGLLTLISVSFSNGNGYHLPQDVSKEDSAKAVDYEKLQGVEDRIIKDVLKSKGAGRFTIVDIKPDEDGTTGSIAVVEIPNSHLINLKTLYPKDQLKFIPTELGLQPVRPMGNLSIWRFIGKVEFQDHKFIGDKTEPLTFMLLRKAGFVYLHGKGTVVLKNGREVLLPTSKQRTKN